MSSISRKNQGPTEIAARSVGYSPALSVAQMRRKDELMVRQLDNKTFADVHAQKRPQYGPGSEVRVKSKASRVALAAGALSTVALGAKLLNDHIYSEAENHIQVIEPGDVSQDLPSPEDTIIHVTQPGDTAIGIAQKYDEQTDETNLADKIYDAAKDGKDPGLDPGDQVVIPK